MKQILIIQAHPDAQSKHYCHALAEAYRSAAFEAGHDVKTIDIGKVEVSFLRSKSEWESHDNIPEFVTNGQKLVDWSDHLVFIYPLWLGTMPALLKAWLEQVLRPSFAFNIAPTGQGWKARLGGRSARVVITMGMPVFVYRWFFLSHSLKSFQRNILKFAGVKPIHTSMIGMVEGKNDRARKKWLVRMKKFGKAGI